MWKKSVEKISQSSDFALIDLSIRSDNIEWELNYLKTQKKGHFLIMIDGSRCSDQVRTEFKGILIEYETKSLSCFEKRLKARFQELRESRRPK